MKFRLIFQFILLFCTGIIVAQKSTIVPLAGNVFFSNYAKSGVKLSKSGIQNWADPLSISHDLCAFFRKRTLSNGYKCKSRFKNDHASEH